MLMAGYAISNFASEGNALGALGATLVFGQGAFGLGFLTGEMLPHF